MSRWANCRQCRGGGKKFVASDGRRCSTENYDAVVPCSCEAGRRFAAGEDLSLVCSTCGSKHVWERYNKPTRDHVHWLQLGSKRLERVGVVNRDGLLVDAGRLMISNYDDRVFVDSELPEGYTRCAQLNQPDEVASVVPMSPEREARWATVLEAHNVEWERLTDDVLQAVLSLVRAAALTPSSDDPHPLKLT